MNPTVDQPLPAEHPTEPSQLPDRSPTTEQPLSKNAQKRLAKAARVEEQKKERRAAEKERRKERRRKQHEEKRAEKEQGAQSADEERARKKRKMGEGPQRPFGANIVVDLGFDDMMTENEIKSLTSQLAYTYSANRKAERPFASLLFTSLNGRTMTRLESLSNAAYKRWVNAHWWQEGYERLWEGCPPVRQSEDSGQNEPPAIAAIEHTGDTHTVNDRLPHSQNRNIEWTSVPKESVVYLTADSDTELTELKEDETYIIGGLCDHNRYKNLCLNKSNDTSIRSARLPIGTYLSELRTRKVLTVNQTFEILLKWIETRDWEQALWAVIPKRKFQDGGNRGKHAGERDADDSDQNGDGDQNERVIVEDTGEVVIDVQTLEEADDEMRGDIS
ncbi:uncharacterized protein FIBRA_05485 [Fibroporia radiculosa]|uniref:tRNA (guanine(9)-N1)-methyltransferase n=1 Tax=Fibroporia radiculosa TaxID=599839 RepID=J4IAR2_9APHY|nr:uncharacterized protein FIBRA_05485 [Fibroporia radiculosa]CCM03356.1 predicted protein [Fibroporia radiculosa]